MSLAELPKPVPLPSSTLRSYAMIGIVLYAFGFVLNSIGTGLSQFWLVPYADTISALGFVVALYTASLAGLGTRLVVLIGLVYGLGTFYAVEPDLTYTNSGVQIGSASMSHYVGLGLVGLSMVLLVALAFYFTRVKAPHASRSKVDAGSQN